MLLQIFAMSLLSDNIRYLRNQLGYSQQRVADELIITRGRYGKYEDAVAEPPIEILLKISRYFHVSIDLLVTVDLGKIALPDILALPDNRIILPIKEDNTGNNNIEILPYNKYDNQPHNHNDLNYTGRKQIKRKALKGNG